MLIDKVVLLFFTWIRVRKNISQYTEKVMKYLLIFLLANALFFSHTNYASVLVSAENASSIFIQPTRSSPAQVVALNHSVIPAQTSGVITKLLVNVGDKVVKGETFAVLDCHLNTLAHTSEAAQYEQIYSQLLFNKRELVRGRTLLTQKNIGEAELDRLKQAVETSRTSLQAQKSAVDRALLNIERCNIKAPFTGVITRRMANLGEMIDFGKPVAELLEDDSLEISAQVATSDELSFTQAKVYTLDIAGELFDVTLRAALPFIENNTRSREMRFIFINKQALAGSTGRLRWKSPTMYLPAYLLQKREGKKGYFILDNQQAKFVVVDNAEEGRPINFNLSATTQVITEGYYGLNDGDDVQLSQHKSMSGEGL